MVPKVDTFEGNISDEIKRKEASLTEISSASNNVGNNDDILLPKRRPIFLIATICVFILCLIGFAALAYYYFNDSILSPKKETVLINPTVVPKVVADIKNISPTLFEQIGRFVTRVEKKDKGYVITISEYSPVFAYVTRNEKNYIEELSLLFPATQVQAVSSSTPPKITPPLIATTTITASSSNETASTTKSTTTKSLAVKKAPTKQKTSTTTAILATSTPDIELAPLPEEVPVGPYFTDVTIANQNMRVWNGQNNTVVYAFVGNTTILISNSTDGILALKGAILR